jgi:hypothetical protein
MIDPNPNEPAAPLSLEDLPYRGTQTIIPTPVVPLNPEKGGFFQNVADEIKNSWWMQGTQNLLESNIPAEPGFSAFDNDRLKGKEPYAGYLRQARSQAHFDAIWQRIEAYETRRARLAKDGGLVSALTAGIIDPLNLLPFGVAVKGGAAIGAVRGGATVGGAMIGANLVQQDAVPTSTSEMVYSTLIGVGLGGALGGIIGRNVPTNARITELAKTIDTEMRVLDDLVESGMMTNPFDPTTPAGTYVAKPSVAGATGIAPAFGLEKFVGVSTDYGRMVTVSRSFEDLGNAMAGEGDVLFNRNKLAGAAGEKTQDSATLRALYWQGQGGTLLMDLQTIYNRYLGGGDNPAMLGSLNIPVTVSRMRSAAGLGPEGKISLNEFHSEVARAHKSKSIESDNPFVKEAAERVRKFYDEMRDAGIEANLIVTPQTINRLVTRFKGWTAAKRERLAELAAKENPTPNEKAEMAILEKAVAYGRERLAVYMKAQGPETKAPVLATADEFTPETNVLRAANDDLTKDGNVTRLPQSEARTQPAVDPRAKIDAPANENFSAFTGPENEANYLNRIWVLDKVATDEAGPKKLRAILTQWYKDNPLQATPGRAEEYVATIDRIAKSAKDQIVDKKVILAELKEFGERSVLSERQIAFIQILSKRIAAGGTPKQLAALATLAKKHNAEVMKAASERRARAGIEGENAVDLEMEAKSIEKRVDRTIAHILKTAELGEMQTGNMLDTPFLARDLNIPNEKVWDFIEDDVSVLIRSYSDRVGKAIEYGRMFGSRDAELAIFDASQQTAKELKGTEAAILKKVNKTAAHARNLRDFVLGDVYAANPLSLNRRIVQGISAYSTITSLGNAMVTSLNEVTKSILVHGVARNFDFALKALADRDLYRSISRENRALNGEGAGTALNMTLQRMGEQGGVIGGTQNFAGRHFDKATSKLINFANGPYFAWNLLGPYTDMTKNWAGVMASNYLIEDAIKVARGTASAKDITNLRALSFDIDDAKRLAKMPFEQEKGLLYANVGQWNDNELMRKFAAAVASQQRRTIVTAGNANMPNFTRGFVGLADERREIPYLRLPTQLMNFAFASVNKTLLSALQGRDANAFVGMTAMVAMGYYVTWLKTPASIWDRLSMEDKVLRGVEQSGVLAVFGDMLQKVEGLSRGEYGVRKSMGLPPKYGNMSIDEYAPFGEVFGPAGGKATDFYQMMFDTDVTTREQARLLRRAVPMTDLFYLKGLVRDVERKALEAIY